MMAPSLPLPDESLAHVPDVSLKPQAPTSEAAFGMGGGVGPGTGAGTGIGSITGSGDSESSVDDEQPGSARSTLPSASLSLPSAHCALGAGGAGSGDSELSLADEQPGSAMSTLTSLSLSLPSAHCAAGGGGGQPLAPVPATSGHASEESGTPSPSRSAGGGGGVAPTSS